MKYLLSCLILLSIFLVNAHGQDAAEPKKAIAIAPTVLELNKEKLKTPDSEVKDAVVFLQEEFDEESQQYIRFFSTYALQDKKLREDTALALSFICHSMTGAVTEDFPGGGYYPIAKRNTTEDGGVATFEPLRKVTDSDTLWWVDLREFNWTEAAWELISKEDGYFVEPIVTHDANSLLRLIAGNAVLRADWFIVHASSLTNQSDVGSQTKIYKELLYGSLGKDKIPKTVKEFESAWSINTEQARKIGNFYGTLVTKSQNVARHNRILNGYDTELGWYYKSFDVKFQRGKRDYAENIIEYGGEPPTVFDGGEIFASNFLRMQVYDLYDGQENLADFADPTIVRHYTDILTDVRVRTPHSCFDCHAAGPIPSENTLLEFITARAEILVKDKKKLLKLKRVYLDGRFEDSITQHQTLFENALKKINGLKPAENGSIYLKLVENYNKPLDIEQAAYECGLTKELFIEGLTKNNKVEKNKVPFRVALLIEKGERIPRDVWEHPGLDGQPGLFQQSMILINGLTKITQEEIVEEVKKVEVVTEVILAKPSYIYSSMTNNTVLSTQQLPKGTKLKKSEDSQTKEGWVGVEYNSKTGFVKTEDIENE